MRRGPPVRRQRPGGTVGRKPALSRRIWIVVALLIAAAGAAYIFFGGSDARRVQHVRDESRRFAAAEQRLRAEPNVANVVYAPERGSWNVELPPGAQVAKGFAGYLCTILAGEEMIDRRTSVRTVDSLKLAKSGFDYEAATLEHVRCRAIVPETPRSP